MTQKKPSLKRCAKEFDRATFDALIADKESEVRSNISTKGPSKNFLRLTRLYGQERAYTVLAAEKIMAKIIEKRQKLEDKPIPYESWPKDRARIEVSGMYPKKPQTIVRPAAPHGRRWTHGFDGTS